MLRGRRPAGTPLSGSRLTLRFGVLLGLGAVACQPPHGATPARAGRQSDAAPAVGPAADGGADAPDAPAVAGTVLHVRVHDAATGLPVPAKLFLTNADTQQQLHFGDLVDQPLCTGMAGSLHELGDGQARLAAPERDAVPGGQGAAAPARRPSQK